MKLVKTKPRFRCDFCKYTATMRSVEKHEKYCWRNPDRHCDLCNDKGWYDEGDGYIINKTPCPYCSQYDPSKLPEIENPTLLGQDND